VFGNHLVRAVAVLRRFQYVHASDGTAVESPDLSDEHEQ
jgi:hypothetical protein